MDKTSSSQIMRESESWIVWKIWQSIDYINSCGELPYTGKVKNHLTTQLNVPELRATNQMDLAFKDGLIFKDLATRALYYPKTIKKSDKDWYCFLCHKAGPVAACKSCWRVYHSYCLDDFQDGNVCDLCTTKISSYEGADRKPLFNTYLKKVFQKFKNDHCKYVNMFKYSSNLLERLDLIMARSLDIEDIERKIDMEAYINAYDFELDLKSLLHNVMIRFGPATKKTTAASYLLSSYLNNKISIENCIECYCRSLDMDKEDYSWFIESCTPPHSLVYVKLQGFPLWPAKIMRSSSENVSVWYFGSDHEQETISPKQVRSYHLHTTSNKNHRKDLKDALNELNKHLEKLKSSNIDLDSVKYIDSVSSGISISSLNLDRSSHNESSISTSKHHFNSGSESTNGQSSSSLSVDTFENENSNQSDSCFTKRSDSDRCSNDQNQFCTKDNDSELSSNDHHHELNRNYDADCSSEKRRKTYEAKHSRQDNCLKTLSFKTKYIDDMPYYDAYEVDCFIEAFKEIASRYDNQL